MVTDPVCKMAFEFEDAQSETTYDGVTYYFCSEACKETFELTPAEYIPKRGKKTAI